MQARYAAIVLTVTSLVGACNESTDRATPKPNEFPEDTETRTSDDGVDGEVRDTDRTNDSGSERRDTTVSTSDTSADTASDEGTDIGTFWNTYYYLADESEYTGADDTSLLDAQCEPIADVPSDFASDACIEGSARLEDGTVINYAESCSCGPCSFCWAELDPDTHPWGMGSMGNALQPLRSWAVDTDILEFGTVVYVPKWDGVPIPEVGELGGFVHDGCFRADDVGGGIEGRHFDLFAGTPAMRRALEEIHPTRSDFRVFTNSGNCSNLE